MALVKAEVKRRLTDEGRWYEYRNVRESFRRKGLNGLACWEQALLEKDAKGRLFGKPLDMPPGLGLPPMASSTYANPSAAAEPESRKAAPDAETFRNKGKAQYADAVNWVATNLHLANVDENDAPNGIAVNLRRDCLDIPRVREIFWSAIFPKLLPSEKEIVHMRKAEGRNPETEDALATYERAVQEAEAPATKEQPKPSTPEAPEDDTLEDEEAPDQESDDDKY